MISNIVRILRDYGPLLLSGVWGTLWISTVVVFFGTILGALLSLARMYLTPWISKPLVFFIEFVRGTPLLLQLYFFVYGIAVLLGNPGSDTIWVIVALIVNSAAYVSEVFRSGINAVDKGQFEAAYSLGLSQKNTMVKIILPQAIKNILPALGNEFIMMIKETSLAALLFIPSLMTSQAIISSRTYLSIESLLIVGVVYFVITYTLSKGVQYMEKRLNQHAR